MAAPEVAGALVLLAAARPDLDAAGLRYALLAGTRKGGLPVATGALDVGASLRAVIAAGRLGRRRRRVAVVLHRRAKKPAKKTRRAKSVQEAEAHRRRRSAREPRRPRQEARRRPRAARQEARGRGAGARRGQAAPLSATPAAGQPGAKSSHAQPPSGVALTHHDLGLHLADAGAQDPDRRAALHRVVGGAPGRPSPSRGADGDGGTKVHPHDDRGRGARARPAPAAPTASPMPARAPPHPHDRRPVARTRSTAEADPPDLGASAGSARARCRVLQRLDATTSRTAPLSAEVAMAA